jgi:hypothetical protein
MQDAGIFGEKRFFNWVIFTNNEIKKKMCFQKDQKL